MYSVSIAIFTALIAFPSEPNQLDETSLSHAITAFNKEAKADAIGKSQAPLTEDEVIAAILIWEPGPDTPVSKKLLAQFRTIAETKKLPGNATFEKLTGYDRGGAHIFDVWSVRIRIQRADASSYAFVLRERVISSRTLAQELAMLKHRAGALPGKERIPGWHRIETRIRDLEKRIKDQAR